MPIIVGIDGTGGGMIYDSAGRNAEYDRDFANSFVRRISFGKTNAKYIRGPIGAGGGMPEGIQEGLNFVRAKRQQLPTEPILMTGYSRGALGVVVIAKELKNLGINVKALMMFDCVDRHAAFDAEVIPNNVENVMHVIRDPAARSRMTFGNDGMSYTPPTIYQPIRKFMCTHGGMGGCPWQVPSGGNPTDFVDEGTGEALFSPVRNGPVWEYTTNVTYAQDAFVSTRVWSHCQSFLTQHGFI
ncbi:MAG: hypothetical protein AAB336_11455 [Acidobacteriota bacterium]